MGFRYNDPDDIENNQNVSSARKEYNDAKSAMVAGRQWDPGQLGADRQRFADMMMKRADPNDPTGKFSYDLNADMLYEQYKNQYMALGNLAMQSTIGQASSLTGGYANSYAVTAGNQAYDDYLKQLNDRIPELYSLALTKYQMEGDQLNNAYNVLNNAYEQAYGMHRDTVGDLTSDTDRAQRNYQDQRDFYWNSNKDIWNMEFQEERAEEQDRQWQADYDYRAQRDAVSDSRYEDSKNAQALQLFADKNAKGSKAGSKSGSKTAEESAAPKTLTKADVEEWDAVDWEEYFANIRNSENADAAEEELDNLKAHGLIPSKYMSAASVGAKGKMKLAHGGK